LLSARPGISSEDYQHPYNGQSVGPPPKRYTRGLHDKIVQLIAEGHRPEAAAGACGIPRATFYAWMQKGKEGDPHLAQFAEDVDQAFDLAECRAVNAIIPPPDPDNPKKNTISKEDAKWWLEKQRKAFNKKVQVEVERDHSEMIARFEANLPPAVFRQVLSLMVGVNTPELKAVTDNDTD